MHKISIAVFYKIATENRSAFKDMGCVIAIILGLTLESLFFQLDKFYIWL